MAKRTTEKVSIYDHSDFASYLTAYVKSKRKNDRSYSFGVLARLLKIKSTSQLTMIARGERNPSHDLMLSLCRHLNLSKRESKYAEILVNFHKAKTVSEKLHFSEQLKLLKPTNVDLLLDIDTIDMICKWHHIAILEMADLKDWQPRPAWIVKRLGGIISKEQALESLTLLQRLKLLVPKENARLVRSAVGFTSPRFRTSEAIRMFHKSMFERAIFHLDHRPVSDRYFTGTAIAIDKSKLPQAKEMVAEFRDQLKEYIWSKKGDEVFYLAFQLFPITED